MKTSVILRCGYEPCRSFNVSRIHKPEDFEKKQTFDPYTGEEIVITDPETGENTQPNVLKDPTFFRLWCNDCSYTTELHIVDGQPKVDRVLEKEGGDGIV